MIQILQRNAAEMRRLNCLVHETYASRDQSAQHWAAWESACKEFHANFDRLAFPGGLRRELQLLPKSDVQASAYALLYLENPPYSFRSQYIATTLRRALNKIAARLPKNLQDRFAEYKKLSATKKLARSKKLEPMHRAVEAARRGLAKKLPQSRKLAQLTALEQINFGAGEKKL